MIRYFWILCVVGVIHAETLSRTETNKIASVEDTSRFVEPITGDSFTNLISIIRTAEKVTPPKNIDGLQWLFAKWKCTARLLTKRAGFSTRYVYIDEFEFVADLFKPISKPTGGYEAGVVCSYVRPYREDEARIVEVVFNMDGFYYKVPHADHFLLKKEPIAVPNWFLLEHQVSGDMLIFKRLPK